ncbi:6-phospho-alpha-glucosidase [Vibrio sp. DW001]|uniref:family 4 glycosyl hydrolase n=1 Tax=Vibrio sp. DW001 TaxID=2912315 RepID=UPI0023B04C01|nr:maltose-6'-phosphate glucosidase [Vibrio sp. DW001]WED25749.1 6-phospho-alpha-glucosidase [Vibrio sp. DW001]
MNNSFAITIAGGGSTYTTGIVMGLLSRRADFPVDSIMLFDNDGERQSKVSILVELIVKDSGCDIKVNQTTDPKIAFTGCDFVLAQLRSGGLRMREVDEKVPLTFGCVGQETCGIGGFSYGMRSIKDMIDIVEQVNTYAPQAWILNYSNPASIVAEAINRAHPDAKILNICDMPLSIERSIAEAINVDVKDLECDYFGLNHFGWWTHIWNKNTGEDLLPKILELTRTSGITQDSSENSDDSWAATFKMLTNITTDFPDLLPNTYLQYYLYPDEIVAKSNPEYTRANQVMDGREANVFNAAKVALAEGSLKNTDLRLGVHGEFIVDVARSIAMNEKNRFLIIVQNNGAIPNMRSDAMVEIPCYVGARGPEPIRFKKDIPTFQKGLMENQCAAEKLLVDAFFEQSYEKALQAFTLNRTVPSATVAKKLLDAVIKANGDQFPPLN